MAVDCAASLCLELVPGRGPLQGSRPLSRRAVTNPESAWHPPQPQAPRQQRIPGSIGPVRKSGGHASSIATTGERTDRDLMHRSGLARASWEPPCLGHSSFSSICILIYCCADQMINVVRNRRQTHCRILSSFRWRFHAQALPGRSVAHSTMQVAFYPYLIIAQPSAASRPMRHTLKEGTCLSLRQGAHFAFCFIFLLD